MNPPSHQGQPLSERIALLEQSVPRLEKSIETLLGHYSNMERDINTMCVSMATLSTKVQTIVNERVIWKNPQVYISVASVVVAIAAVWLSK